MFFLTNACIKKIYIKSLTNITYKCEINKKNVFLLQINKKKYI